MKKRNIAALAAVPLGIIGLLLSPGWLSTILLMITGGVFCVSWFGDIQERIADEIKERKIKSGAQTSEPPSSKPPNNPNSQSPKSKP